MHELRRLNPAAAAAASAQLVAMPIPARPLYDLRTLERQDQHLRERIDYVANRANNYVNGESERQNIARNHELHRLEREEQWTRRTLDAELSHANELLQHEHAGTTPTP